MNTKFMIGQLKDVMLLALATGLILLIVWGLNRHKFPAKNSYTIGIFYNSVNLTSSDIEVIKFLTEEKIKEINEKGGLLGKPVQALYLDDKGSRETAYKLTQESMQDNSLIAYIGLWGSTRVQAVADLVGKAGIPFIGGYSVTNIAENYSNIYSYEIGVEQAVFLIVKLLNHKGGNIAFIGNSNDVYTSVLFEALHKASENDSAFQVVMEKWYPNDHKFTEQELASLADSLQTTADLLVVSTHPGHTTTLTGAIAKRYLKLPVVTAFTDIPEIEMSQPGFSQMELYDISVFGVPSALNLRSQEIEVKFRKQIKDSPRKLFQLGLGGTYADAIGLIQEASQTEEDEIALSVREKINKGLLAYIDGRKVYKGWFSDWYFTPDRMLASELLLGWKPKGLIKPVLAPLQYLRSDTGMQQVPVFYTRIDLLELDQINDENGTFQARFFLDISSKDSFNLDQVDFVNAVRNKVNKKPLLAVKLIRSGQEKMNGDFKNYLFQVTGLFHFEPDLKKYPFDQQRLSIILQTNSALRPFLIQPPANQQQVMEFSSPGWKFKNHFVGFDQDLIYSGSSIKRRSQHIPYYKFSYTYVLKRAKVDFFLKVLTPLLVIIITAYLSVFIPIREFVSVAVIQVTALLSAIALYFSAYKPQMAAATTSDKIFIFTYIMITTTIGTSVLEYWLYRRRRSRRQISVAVAVYERILFPVIVTLFILFMAFYGNDF